MILDAFARPDTIIFLHGLGRTWLSMAWLAGQARRRGYAVINHGYRSRRHSIAEHAEQLRIVVGAVTGNGRIHFITHSLGGIVVRAMLADRASWPERLGRVVMMSPPNQGSELVDFLAGNPIYDSVLGPAGGELGTRRESTPNRLGPVEFEVGVITGDRSFEPLSRRIFPGRTDGKVSVARAQVEGMRDFRVVRRSHTFIMYGGDVADAAFHFLEHGRFPSESGAEESPAPV
jgi:pimeloyl-ACP methyl ester carboxylesterase